MMTLEELAADELARCNRVLRGAGMHAIDPRGVLVAYDLRGRSRAGLAQPSTGVIRLNRGYYEALGETYRSTIAHEYAHLVVRSEERVRGWSRSASHGTRWRNVMRVLGYKPTRTLTEDEVARSASVKPARVTQKFPYVCPRGHTFNLGIVRHRNIQSGVKYFCRNGACGMLDKRLCVLKGS